VQGYRFTISNPARSAADLEKLAQGLDPALVSAELGGLLPAFTATDGRVGELSTSALRSWASWEARFRIVSRPPDVASAFDPAIVAGSSSR
jgi:hypothetical protein